MKQYLILAETGETGCFVEIVNDLETALSREKLFFELAFNPPTNHKKMREEFKPLGTYSIDDEHSFAPDALSGTSNGIDATYVLEVDESFSVEGFGYVRKNSVARFKTNNATRNLKKFCLLGTLSLLCSAYVTSQSNLLIKRSKSKDDTTEGFITRMAHRESDKLIKEGKIYDPTYIKNHGAGADANYFEGHNNSLNSNENSKNPSEKNNLFDKYVDCGLSVDVIKGGQLSEKELNDWCERLKKERSEKLIRNGLIFLVVLVGIIVGFQLIKRSNKAGIEFQRMAEAFNGIYGIIADWDFNNIPPTILDSIKKDLLYCAYISEKEIMGRLRIYNWGMLTPINVPLISDKTINLQIALKKTVGVVRDYASKLDFTDEVEEIFSHGALYSELDETISRGI